jgi:TolA-binding protein
MSDDLLDMAKKALRETTEPSAEELARLRARLESSQKEARVTRLHFVRWALPLAATFLAASALAAVPSVREAVVEAVQAIVERVSGPAPQPKSKPKPAKRAVPVAQPREPTVAPAPADAGPPLSPPKVNDVMKRPRKTATPAPAVPYDAELEAYKQAHSYHFTQHQYDLALRSWEEYRARFPDGRFAVEAKYNRALCLVRLGRREEARRALEPFANGSVASGYRQREARQLLEALSAQP